MDGNQPQLAILINNFPHSRPLHGPIDKIVRVSFTLFDSLRRGLSGFPNGAVGYLGALKALSLPLQRWQFKLGVILKSPGQRLQGHVHGLNLLPSTSCLSFPPIHAGDQRGHLQFHPPLLPSLLQSRLLWLRRRKQIIFPVPALKMPPSTASPKSGGPGSSLTPGQGLMLLPFPSGVRVKVPFLRAQHPFSPWPTPRGQGRWGSVSLPLFYSVLS